MKKLFVLLVCALALSANATAQRIAIEHKKFEGQRQTRTESIEKRLQDDELEIIYPGNWLEADSIIVYETDIGGYVIGSNGYDDLAKAQLFEVTDPYELHGILFWVGALDGTTGNVHFRIWEFNKRPGNVIASKTLRVNQIIDLDYENEDIYIEFDPPLLLEKDFLAGIDVSGIGSSDIGIVSTMDGRGTGRDLVWEQWDTGDWYSLLDEASFELDIDLAIFPVVRRLAGSQALQVKQVSQRTDGSGLADVYFDLNLPQGQYFIELEVSLDGGASYAVVNPAYISGAYPVSPGTGKHLVFDAGLSFPGASTAKAKARLTARTGLIVNTLPAKNVSANSATLSGEVVSAGASPVIARGIAYGTSPNPTIAGNSIAVGSGLGSYTAEVQNLQPNTIYYVRAYALSNQETAYGHQVTFTTPSEGPPAIAGPGGSSIVLPPESAAYISQITVQEAPASTILKPGEQAASVAMKVSISNHDMIGSMGDYEIHIPVTLKNPDPTRLRMNVKVKGDIILPVPGHYDPDAQTYTIKTFGLANEWVIGVASGKPINAILSQGKSYAPDVAGKDASAAWPSLDFWIFDASDTDPKPLTEDHLTYEFQPIARDALITLQSSGFAAPRLRLDDKNRFHMVLIDREKIVGLGDASYYEPPDQQLLGRIFINYPPYINDYSKPTDWRLKNVIIHETFHAVQWGYEFENHSYQAAFAGNKQAYASSAYLEGTASLIGATYENRGSIGTSTVYVDPDFPPHNLGFAVDEFAVSNPYAKQDFYAFVAKRYFNGSLTYLDALFKGLAASAPAKMDQATINYLLKLRKGMNSALSNLARPLPEIYTEYALQRLYLHEPKYLLRNNEDPGSDTWFTRNLLAQSLLTEGSSFKKWQSSKEDEFAYDQLSLQGIRPLASAAAIFSLPPELNPDFKPDSLKFNISITGGGKITNVLATEGIKILIIRSLNEYGTPVEENAIVYVNDIEKPIPVYIREWTSHLVFLVINSYVEEVPVNVSISLETEECELDPNLFGYWVYLDEDDNVTVYYLFREDGTAVQHIYGQNYDWYWCVEGGKLKLYIPHGKPAYSTYKIEGNKLYFYVDSVGVWGLPFTKQ